MEWVWELYKAYITKQMMRPSGDDPGEAELEQAFLEALGESTVTILVQEPWRGSVRFKRLARFPVRDRFDLLSDPMGFLTERYGGGKFKLNFHRGWHFVATQNFKPEGVPKWKDLPELEA